MNSCTCRRALVTRRSPGCCCYTPRPREPSLRCVRLRPGSRVSLRLHLPQHAPVQPADDCEPEVPLRGWQRPASGVRDDFALAEQRRSVGPAELELLDSQSGPFAARLLPKLHRRRLQLAQGPGPPLLTVAKKVREKKNSPSTRPLSACYCSAAFDFLCRWPQPAAVANARWMCWVIMSQLTPGPAPYVSEVGRLNGPLHVSAAKPAQLLRQMCWSATSTSKLQGRMSGALRSLLMDFLCGVARSSQLTPPWCPPFTSAGAPRRRCGATAGPAQPLQVPAEATNAPTYPEFGRASRCRLIVLGIEVGGRWSAEAANFVRLLVVGSSTSTHCPPSVSCSNHRCRRWAMVGVVAGRCSKVLRRQLAPPANLQYRQS